MSAMKEYMMDLAEHCAGENEFAIEAIQYGVMNGMVHISYNPFQDEKAIMAKYDNMIEAYQQNQKAAKQKPKMFGTPREFGAWTLFALVMLIIVWMVCFV